MIRALVTGGSGAIGAAICRRLAAAGRRVAVHANRNLAQAEQVAQNIRAAGGAADAVAFDITNEQETALALEKLLADGPVQIVVNNAGIHADAPMAGMSGEQWKSVLDVSLHGFFNVTKPLLLPMIGTRWGRIVSLSSVAAVRGNRGQTNYAAAKAGLHGATRSLALELASRGVTVNAVAPGVIASPMTKANLHRQRDQRAGADEARRPARGGGGAGRLPRFRRGRLHLGPGDLDRRRHDMKVMAVIPAYNEAATIRDVARRALAELDDVIVVDDGSTDGTAAALADLPRHADLESGESRQRARACGAVSPSPSPTAPTPSSPWTATPSIARRTFRD